MPALREKRGLTEREVLGLKKALENLRVAAAAELRLTWRIMWTQIISLVLEASMKARGQ